MRRDWLGMIRTINGRPVAATAPTDGQALAWSASAKRWQPTTVGGGGGTDVPLTTPLITTGLKDANGNTLLAVTATASAINYLGIKNTATTDTPELTTNGPGSNVDLKIACKGDGKVVIPGAGVTDGTEWRLKANGFLPGVADFRNVADSDNCDLRAKVITSTGGHAIADAKDVAVGTSTGTKLGTSASQKLGKWGVTPIVQPASSAQAALTNSTGGTGDGTLEDVTTTGLADPAKVNNNFTEIYTLLNAIRSALVSGGNMKGSA